MLPLHTSRTAAFRLWSSAFLHTVRRPVALFGTTSGDTAAPREFRLACADGVEVALRAHGRHGKPVLCLHGWLDNVNSWNAVAPALAEEGYLVVAMDFPGHGESDHRGKDAQYHAVDWAFYAAEVPRLLGWDKYGVLGHSMGGGAAALLAAAQPDKAAAMVCVEMLGPLSQPEANAATSLRRGLQSRLKLVERLKAGSTKIYDSFAACVAARQRTVESLPGKQKLTPRAAEQLVQRGAMEVDGGWAFCHDVRLLGSSATYLTENQVLRILEAIECPSLAIMADPELGEGWPKPEGMLEGRQAAVKNMMAQCLPGGHHLHLDHDTAPAVLDAMLRFLNSVDADKWPRVSLQQ